MKTKHLALAAVTISSLAFSTISNAEEFEGAYIQKETGVTITIKKLDEGKYSISCEQWDGMAFWDKTNKSYEGVFRYNDGHNLPAGEEGVKNAVGYHNFKMSEDGGVTVSLQWDLSKDASETSYTLTKKK